VNLHLLLGINNFENLFDLSLMSLYLFALRIDLVARFSKLLPKVISLKLAVEGLELMTKAFKLALKLNVGHFSADLSKY
jgi:hypothetical protein